MTVEHYEGLEVTTENLKRILTEEGARDLAKVFGGRELYVPRSPGEHHPITVAIGQARADQLAGAFHGVKIQVPMLAQTASEIRRLDGLGWTRRRIAGQLHITERWVYKVLEESEVSAEPPRQGGLFG